MENKNEPTLELILKEINEKLDVLIEEQKEIKNDIKQKNKVIMQRINKIEEYNNIDEMRNQVLNEHVDKIAKMILEIQKKLY